MNESISFRPGRIIVGSVSRCFLAVQKPIFDRIFRTTRRNYHTDLFTAVAPESTYGNRSPSDSQGIGNIEAIRSINLYISRCGAGSGDRTLVEEKQKIEDDWV